MNRTEQHKTPECLCEPFRTPLIHQWCSQQDRKIFTSSIIVYIHCRLLSIFTNSVVIAPKAISLPFCPPVKHRWDKEKGNDTKAGEKDMTLCSLHFLRACVEAGGRHWICLTFVPFPKLGFSRYPNISYICCATHRNKS